MLGGAPGTAACVAAGGILVAEAGTHGLALGAALLDKPVHSLLDEALETAL